MLLSGKVDGTRLVLMLISDVNRRAVFHPSPYSSPRARAEDECNIYDFYASDIRFEDIIDNKCSATMRQNYHVP